MSFFRKALETFGVVTTNDSSNDKSGQILDSEVGQDLIAFLATQRAGKTTHASGLLACIQYKASGSAKTDKKFRYYLDEGGGSILHQIGELRAGHFPPATTAGKRISVRPGFTLEWENPTLFGSRVTTRRQVKSKLLDLAGEDLVKIISQVSAARNFEQAAQIKIDDELIRTVNQATALFVIIKATRAEGLPISEPEPTNIPGMSSHSDANLAGMITAILTFKHNNHYSPRLKRFFVVVTACDELFPISEIIERQTGRPFNPLDPKISSDSLDSFVRAYFPSTHSTICSMQVKTRYFPSFFELERDSKNQPIPWTEGSKDWKIKRGNIFDTPDWENNVNRPKFSEYWFNQEIDALEDLAVSV
jgi:hypothetical protein